MTRLLTSFSFGLGLITLVSNSTHAAELELLTAPRIPNATANGTSADLAISPDGRFVLLVSTALDLTTNVVGGFDLQLYVADRQENTVSLVTASGAGAPGDGSVFSAAMSSDGQKVVFESAAANLVADDTNGNLDIFIADRTNGTVERVTGPAGSGSLGDGGSNVQISRDGALVLIDTVTALTPSDTNGLSDVYLWSKPGGLRLLSSGPGMTSRNVSSAGVQISADSKRILWVGVGNNDALIPLDNVSDTNSPAGVSAIYVHDLVTGTTSWVSEDAKSLIGGNPTIVDALDASFIGSNEVLYRAAHRSGGLTSSIIRHNLQSGESVKVVESDAVGDLLTPIASADGSAIFYMKNGHLLRHTSANSAEAVIVPFEGSLEPNAANSFAISADGNLIAFVSESQQIIEGASDWQLYMRDLDAGSTKIITQDADGEATEGNDILIPVISADGSVVLFTSAYSGFVENDFNNDLDVFVYDMTEEEIQLITRADPESAHEASTGWSRMFASASSHDGSRLVFESTAENLAPNDGNGLHDIFLLERPSGLITLLSTNAAGFSPDGSSQSASISPNGRYVTFETRAVEIGGEAAETNSVFCLKDLTTGAVLTIATGQVSNVMWQSDSARVLIQTLQNGFTYDIASSSVSFMTNGTASGMSRDGSHVAWYNAMSTTISQVGYADLDSDRVATTNLSGVSAQIPVPRNTVAVTPEGGFYFALASRASGVDRSAQLIRFDPLPSPRTTISTNPASRNFGLDPSGNWLLFGATSTNTPQQAFVLRNLATGADTIISLPGAETLANAFELAISRDAAHVAFTSRAETEENPERHNTLYLYNRASAQVTRIAPAVPGVEVISAQPQFSGDGRTLFFTSTLHRVGDFVQPADIFALDLSADAPADSDSDWMNDSWETMHFGNLAQTGSSDFDEDGKTNLQEFHAETNPAFGTGGLSASISLSASGGAPIIFWTAEQGRTYQVQRRHSLTTGVWENVGVPVTATSSVASQQASLDATTAFYRVQRLP